MARIARFLNAANPGGTAAPLDFEATREQFRGSGAGEVYKPRSACVRPKLDHFDEAQCDTVLENTHAVWEAFGYSMDGVGAGGGDGGAGGGGGGEMGGGGGTQRVKCVNKGVTASMVVNTGDPMDKSEKRICLRPITAEDPSGRGFPWKWELRKIVRVKAKAAEKTRTAGSGDGGAATGVGEAGAAGGGASPMDVEDGSGADGAAAAAAAAAAAGGGGGGGGGVLGRASSGGETKQ